MPKKDPALKVKELTAQLVSYRDKVKKLKSSMETSDIVLRTREGELEDAIRERESARSIARLLAHSIKRGVQVDEKILNVALAYPRKD